MVSLHTVLVVLLSFSRLKVLASEKKSPMQIIVDANPDGLKKVSVLCRRHRRRFCLGLELNERLPFLGKINASTVRHLKSLLGRRKA